MRFFSINTFTGYPQAEKHAQNLKLLENYNCKVSSDQECEIPHFWAAILNFTHFQVVPQGRFSETLFLS
jgi:hypothetical protein